MASEDHVTKTVNQGSEEITNVNDSDSLGEAGIPRNAHDSMGAVHLASSINNKLSSLAPDTLNYGTVCIYKVPEKHRNKNPQAYTPRLVSIGPLHHGQSHLLAREELKWKYLTDFKRTFKVSVELLAEYVSNQEKFVCGCYEDACVRDYPKLSEMILLDGVFIVELFLKKHFPKMREKDDIIFENVYVSRDILHDLLLFENQLPMRFVSNLYDKFVCLEDDVGGTPSFYNLAYEYFKDTGNTGGTELKNVDYTGQLKLSDSLSSSRHLVEFLAIINKPIEPRDHGEEVIDRARLLDTSAEELCRILREFIMPGITATELRAAGVKFRCAKEECLCDVSFRHGKLKIPKLIVSSSTETFFRNVLIFEQSRYHPMYMTSYVILLDTLIDFPKDVELLVQSGIIDNRLGSHQKVTDIFNNLTEEFMTYPNDFYFYGLCLDLQGYRRNRWHGWVLKFTRTRHKWISKLTDWFAMLKQDYFQSPWTIISVAAAFVLLVLTVIQTVFSVLQVKHPN